MTFSELNFKGHALILLGTLRETPLKVNNQWEWGMKNVEFPVILSLSWWLRKSLHISDGILQ